MPRSCTHMYVHLVWATYNREPLITGECESVVYDCIRQKCRELRCFALAIGGIEDHVHLLIRFRSATSIAHLVKHIKGSSSHFFANVLRPEVGFRWQGTYGGYTVAELQIDRVADYILQQKERHKSGRLWPDLERCFEDGEAEEDDAE
jgi:putative transposase